MTEDRERELEEAIVALRAALHPYATAFLLLPEHEERRRTVMKHVYEATKDVVDMRRYYEYERKESAR